MINLGEITMSLINQYCIEWHYIQPNTFMYGTILRFNKEGTLFENPLMPSGTVIHDWHMLTRFDSDKTVPSLPILKKGHYYQMKLNYDVTPEQAAYVKITFYRKNDTECASLIVENEIKDFKFPEEAYAYKIELINSGLTSLIFKNIIISEVDKQYPEQLQSNDVYENKIKIIDKVLHQSAQINNGDE